jgi:DNA-binding MarR family transcriptional regulator
MSRNFADGVLAGGVKPGAFTALALISANPGASQTELAREMGFDKATIVALIDALEAQGWAQRARAAADRRRHSLVLTRAGEAALKRLLLSVNAIEAPARKGLSQADFRKLIELLDRAHLALAADRD